MGCAGSEFLGPGVVATEARRQNREHQQCDTQVPVAEPEPHERQADVAGGRPMQRQVSEQSVRDTFVDREYWVDIHRAEGQHIGCGLFIYGGTIVVKSVSTSGAIDEWNRANPGQQVREGDTLLSVNGVIGPDSILSECYNSTELSMHFVSRDEYTLCLTPAEVRTLDWEIIKIHDRSFLVCNHRVRLEVYGGVRTESREVRGGDRVLTIGGRGMDAEAMLRRLTTQNRLITLGMRRTGRLELRELATQKRKLPAAALDKLVCKKASDCTATDCAVCLQDFDADTKVAQLPCQHTFCQPCIETWLVNYRGSCPLCVKPVAH